MTTRVVTTRAAAGALAGLIALVTAGTATAQPTGVPQPTAGAPDADGVALRYSAGVDGNLALGVVDRFLIGARGDLLLTTPAWGVYVEPRWTYAEVNDTKTDAEYYLRTIGFLYPRERFYGFTVAMLERSFRRRYDGRVTAGAGLGTNLVRSARLDLLAALGLAYEQTRFKVADFEDRPDETDRDRGVPRIVLRTSGRLALTERGALFADLYVKPGLLEPEDLRVLLKVSLEVALGKAIAVRALLDYTHEEVVIVGTARDELTLAFGLVARGP